MYCSLSTTSRRTPCQFANNAEKNYLGQAGATLDINADLYGVGRQGYEVVFRVEKEFIISSEFDVYNSSVLEIQIEDCDTSFDDE